MQRRCGWRPLFILSREAPNSLKRGAWNLTVVSPCPTVAWECFYRQAKDYRCKFRHSYHDSLLSTVQQWVGLGNRAPEIIKSVENRLWRVVIGLATTSSPLKDLVKDGLRDIQVIISKYHDGSQLEPHWFRAGWFRFIVLVYMAGRDRVILVDFNEARAPISSTLQREEEEESEEEGELLSTVEQSEESYDVMDLDSFATTASGHSPQPSVGLPHGYNSTSFSPPPPYVRQGTLAPSTTRYLPESAPIDPFFAGHTVVNQPSEHNLISTRVVSGGTDASLGEEEEPDKDEGLVNKHLANVTMEDEHAGDSSRDDNGMGEGKDEEMDVDAREEHDSNQDAPTEGEQSGLADVEVGVGPKNGHCDNPHVREEGECCGSMDVGIGGSGGNEHDSSQGVTDEGGRSSSMDMAMGASAEAEHSDNSQEKGTPESSPAKRLPSPADSKGIRSGEQRKNPTRAAKRKPMYKPSPAPPKPKPIPRIKPQSRAQTTLVERNYFEEIEFGGITSIVDMIDLTQDIVSHSSP